MYEVGQWSILKKIVKTRRQAIEADRRNDPICATVKRDYLKKLLDMLEKMRKGRA